MKKPASLSCMVICMTSLCVAAEPLYKSVNEQGEVTFSDSPPPNAVDVQEIEVQVGPTVAQQRESAERVKRMESQANELGIANAERTQQREEAQQQVQQQKKESEVQPVTDDNDGYNYPNRPQYPPVIKPPVHPGRPVRPIQLPAGPILAPGR